MLEEELKAYLDITWSDNATDKKVQGVASRAAHIISSYAGVSIDWEADGLALQLFLDCGRYIWNNAYEDFETNFMSELIALRAKYEVRAEDVTEDES